MALIKRYLTDKIFQDLQKKKIIIIFGARQVGKTTLVKGLLPEYKNSVYLNGDFVDDRERLGEVSRAMVEQFAKVDLLVIDEAQRFPEIGLKLKVIFDSLPDLKIIATGSSAFELMEKASEPLTGRFIAHKMYPLSQGEIDGQSNLEDMLRFGCYPDVVMAQTANEKRQIIGNIASNYLFKDVLHIEYIKNPRALELILVALASQIGSEVSIHELANTLDIDSKTVIKYLDILEKLFIIFAVKPYHTNTRKSLTKKRKYFFFDVGIRNALLNNFSEIAGRNDIGALWENFSVIERMKVNSENERMVSYYFWRAYTGEEIDLIEIENGKIEGFEYKWKEQPLSKKIKKIYREDLRGVGELQMISGSKMNKKGFLQLFS